MIVFIEINLAMLIESRVLEDYKILQPYGTIWIIAQTRLQ
jgi:hypothetical protein